MVIDTEESVFFCSNFVKFFFYIFNNRRKFNDLNWFFRVMHGLNYSCAEILRF